MKHNKDCDIDTISEGEEIDEENTPIVIENPPYPESLSDLDLQNDLDDFGASDLDTVTHSNRSSVRTSMEERTDYSSQPWINPKYRTEKEPSHHCSTWPIRR